jgi:hypothetical protein
LSGCICFSCPSINTGGEKGKKFVLKRKFSKTCAGIAFTRRVDMYVCTTKWGEGGGELINDK